jgi:hypothetical protein
LNLRVEGLGFKAAPSRVSVARERPSIDHAGAGTRVQGSSCPHWRGVC